MKPLLTAENVLDPAHDTTFVPCGGGQSDSVRRRRPGPLAVAESVCSVDSKWRAESPARNLFDRQRGPGHDKVFIPEPGAVDRDAHVATRWQRPRRPASSGPCTHAMTVQHSRPPYGKMRRTAHRRQHRIFWRRARRGACPCCRCAPQQPAHPVQLAVVHVSSGTARRSIRRQAR